MKVAQMIPRSLILTMLLGLAVIGGVAHFPQLVEREEVFNHVLGQLSGKSGSKILSHWRLEDEFGDVLRGTSPGAGAYGITPVEGDLVQVLDVRALGVPGAGDDAGVRVGRIVGRSGLPAAGAWPADPRRAVRPR